MTLMNRKEIAVEKYERGFINSKIELKARPKHRRIQFLVQQRMKLLKRTVYNGDYHIYMDVYLFVIH